MNPIFQQAFVYLCAAVFVVPLAKKLGLGSVLGYLLAGVLIGPFCFGFVGEERESVRHFAEFGVVMMLFLVGLELQPSILWKLRGRIFGAGTMELVGTSLLLMLGAFAFGLGWREALMTGIILAMSSTVIALQSLTERGLLKTAGGQQSFAVLLYEDIAVIPLLALMPLLAMGGGGAESSAVNHTGWIAGLPAWQQVLIVAVAIGGLVLGGRFLVGPALRVIAKTGLRELFTAFALLLVIAIAQLMTLVGLSPALGTFIAGVVLANSEYRHELEGDIQPMKGLLLGLFFMAVGASVNFALIAAQPGMVALVVVGSILLKALVLFGLGRLSGLTVDQSLIFTVALAQCGEFCFVLLGFSQQLGIMSGGLVEFLTVVVALTMASTPVLFTITERFILPRIGTLEVERAADVPDEENQVLIAGYGRFGNIAGRFLLANGIRATVLDHDSDQIDLLRRLGLNAYYGDATRLDLLQAAGAEKASVLLIALDDPKQAMDLAEEARRHFPKLKIVMRAVDREHAYAAIQAGFPEVIHQMTGSAVDAGIAALRALGMRAHRAERAARIFRKREKDSLRELAPLAQDQTAYVAQARHSIANLETLLVEIEQGTGEVEGAWNNEPLRKAVRANRDDDELKP